jgi:hypothetical protein
MQVDKTSKKYQIFQGFSLTQIFPKSGFLFFFFFLKYQKNKKIKNLSCRFIKNCQNPLQNFGGDEFIKLYCKGCSGQCPKFPANN